jgi:hypothetical protein
MKVLLDDLMLALDYLRGLVEQTRGAIGSLNDCNVAFEENTWDHLF